MVKQQLNDIGPAHFKSIMKQQRNNNYNLIKLLCEFIDNIIKKSKNIKITTTLNETKLYKIIISDNYEKGFENINEKGAKNPLNMGHIRDGQDDDDETSEFGIGMKAAAIASSNKFTIYTKVNDKYYKIFFDFVLMSQEPDINKSYNPSIKIIDEEEYKDNHVYENGSTLILEEMREEIYSATNINSISNDIKIQLGSIYGKIINKYNVELTINDNIVISEYDFFEDEKCKIFTQSAKLYYLMNDDTKIKLFLIEYPNNKYFIYKDNKIIQSKDNLNYYLDNKFKVLHSVNNKECLQIDSTFTYFIDNKDVDKITSDIVGIFKDDRRYSNLPLQRRNNGAHNYTLHKICFLSKNIGKQLGMTYNKEILLSNNNNDLVNCIDAIISKNKENFSADISTNKFTKLKELYNKHFKKNDTVENNVSDNNENDESDKLKSIKINSIKSTKLIKTKNITKPIKTEKTINTPVESNNTSILQLLNNTDENEIDNIKIDNIKKDNNTDDIYCSDEDNNSDNQLKYFYLIQNNDNYKIGKTKNYPFNRLRKYGVGHKIFLILEVKSDDFENLVINKLVSEGFTQAKQNGAEREWFKGDIIEIKKCIINLYNEIELSQ